MLSVIIALVVVALGCSIAVAIDSSKPGATKGALGGSLLDVGPVAWFLFTLVLWFVAIPCYLATRPRLVAAKRARAGVRWQLHSARPPGPLG